MDYANDIRKYLETGTAPSQEWVEAAMRECPYCTLPLLLLMKNSDNRDERLLARLAVACPDRKALALAVGDNNEVFKHFYPDVADTATPDTDATIEHFLDAFGSNNPKEMEAIANAIFNPMPDYADLLAAEQEQMPQAADSGDASEEDLLISRFIEQEKERELQAPTMQQTEVNEEEKAEIADVAIETPTENNDSMLSESLAKFYISKQKYSKALEIFENINLNFPEKSIYFADQIRFLRKLVFIQEQNLEKN